MSTLASSVLIKCKLESPPKSFHLLQGKIIALQLCILEKFYQTKNSLIK